MADTAVRLVMTTKGVRESTRQFKEFETVSTRSMSSAESSVARSLARMAAQYISLGVAVNKAIKVMSSGMEFNKFVENQTMSFTVMMKSAEKAKAQMKDLYDFAVNSPLTFKETAGASKQLMAYGFASKELIPTMKMLGSVAIATGHKLDDISYVYGTLRSQGRAYSRDLMQFGMRGIPIYEELAKVMGVNASQIQKMASEGKIGFKEVEQAFRNMTTGSGRFSGIISGYMDTLTGKMFMLSDIWEKTTGALMADTMPVIKQLVADLTTALDSPEFQKTIKVLSVEIAKLASALSSVIVFIANNLGLVVSVLETIVAVKLVQMVQQFGSVASIAQSLSLAFGPFGVALVAILGTAMVLRNTLQGIYNDANERGRTSTDKNTRLSQLTFDLDPVRTAGALKTATNALTAPFGLEMVENQIKPEQIDAIAEKYNVTASEAANALISINALSEAQWKFYLNTKSAVRGMDELAARMNAIQNPRPTMKIQQEFLNSLTGMGEARYADTDFIAKGALGAKDYIEGFADTMRREKGVFKEAFTPKMEEDLLQNEYNALVSALKTGAGVEKLFDKTKFDEVIRARLVQLDKLLDGAGKKAKEIKLPSLDKWWLPEDSAVAATLTAIDDVQLAGEKALYNAQKEIDNRQSIIDANLKNAKLMNDSVDKARMLVKWNEENLKLDKERQQILNDINETNTRNTNMQRYAEYTGQGGGIFTAFQAGAGEAFQKAIDNVDITAFADGIANTLGASLEGTEVGSMASGAMSGGVVGLISTIIAQFVSLLTTIENVNRSLNALTTIFESMKAVSNIVEIIDNAFEPITKHLEQLGEASAPLTAIFVGLLKIANAVMYLMQSPLLAVIQVLADGFKWFYNSVIVPVGNFIVMAVNAIIKVLNKIPGVHIKYLDSLVKLTSTMDDFTDAANYAKDSLGDTIKYLERKLSEIYDSQLDSIQELYEVGAMSATDYEAQVKTLNDSMVTSQDALVSYADKQLSTQTGILQRLLELYALQKIIDEDKLTPEEMKNLLESHGLTASSLSDIMIGSIGTALANRDAAAAKAALIKQQEAEAQARAAEMQRAKGTSMSNLESMISKVERNDISRSTAMKYLSGGSLAAYQDAQKKYAHGTISSTALEFATNLAVYAGRHAALAAFQRDVKATESAIMSATTPEQIKALYNALTSRWAGLDDTFFKNNSVLSYDVGTGYVPYDMMAQIHKGESIIPKTFMDSIRSGELVLGSNNQGSGQTTIVNVSVQGSVITENDLVDKLTTVIYKQRSRGILTA